MKPILAAFSALLLGALLGGCSAIEQEAINQTLLDADLRLAEQNDQLRRSIEVETARLERDVNRGLRLRNEQRRAAGLDPV